VFKGIWAEFATRDIAHVLFDPATGLFSQGPAIKYYDNGYSKVGSYWSKPLTRCPLPYPALAMNSGHCGNWAEFLDNILAYQGIKSSYVSLGADPGFYPGPSPDPHDKAQNYAYMLVGPSLWSFTSKNADGPYAYADPVTVQGTTMTIQPGHVQYHPSSTAIAQGQVTTPPNLFITGDHAIVRTPWGLVDPSYGLPQSLTPYQSMSDYEKVAIAGFAVFYYKMDGHWIPMQLKSAPDTVTFCAHHTCEFRAVPYAQSGAPG